VSHGGENGRLNKEYGTTILVSEAVRNRVEHCFRFKAIASVIAKGMTTETQVYELVEAVAEDASVAEGGGLRFDLSGL